MNLLFTMCGRAGSKGVRNKNVRDFVGVPLPYYTLAAMQLFCERHAAQYDAIDIALNTDSPLLKQLIGAAAEDVYAIDRAPALGGDSVRKVDVIRDSYQRASRHFHRAYGVVVDLDITSPLRKVTDVEAVMEKRAASVADIVTTAVPSRRSPYFNMVTERDGFYGAVIPADFASRQQAPEALDMNASIYAYAKAFLDSDKVRFDRMDVVLMQDNGVLDIDSDDDLELMQVIAAYRYQTDAAYGEIRERAKRYGAER